MDTVKKRQFKLQWWPDRDHPGCHLVALDDGQDFAAIRTTADLDDREQWDALMGDLMRALTRRSMI